MLRLTKGPAQPVHLHSLNCSENPCPPCVFSTISQGTWGWGAWAPAQVYTPGLQPRGGSLSPAQGPVELLKPRSHLTSATHNKQVLTHSKNTTIKFCKEKKQLTLGLPRWLSGKESTCQCRRHGFNPGARKNPGGRKLQPAPAFLSGKCRGQRSLPGYNPWGHKELVVTGWLSTQAQDLLSVSAVVGRVLSTLHFRLNHAHHLRRWYYDYTYWIDVETGACIGNWPVQSWGVSSARRQSPQCS